MQRLHHITGLGVAAVLLAMPAAHADIVNFYGKVVMEDGSPPGRLVGIQRKCGAEVPIREANASGKTGVYYVHLYVSDFGGVFSGGYSNVETLVCYLEAVLPGYTSTRIDLSNRRIAANPQFPDLVLSKQGAGALVEISEQATVPRAAKKPWEQALKYMMTRNWAAAETALRAVVETAPGFVPGWAALGAACQNQQKPVEARKALERAIELDPKRLPLYLALGNVEIHLKDWPAALKTSEALLKADNTHVYLEAYLHNAIARFQQKDIDGALERMNTLIGLDKRQELPRAQYILGIVLEAKGELDAAGTHMRKYLAEHPTAKDAATVAERLANLGKQTGGDLASEVNAADLQVVAAGEARVPGGIKAFSAIARIPGAPTYQDFFLQYCRAILNGSATVASPTAEVTATIRTFVSTMEEFERLGERSGDRITIRLALDTKEQREKTARAIELLGWRLRQSEHGYDVELGDRAIDEARQRIPGVFGVDELEMREAILARRPFQFQIPIESARLVGGAAWTATLRDKRQAVLGPIDIFLLDSRFARVYAGLAAMENETAAAVVSAVGLVPLITRYPGLLAEYGEALSLDGEHVVVPGGVKAEPVWAKLAGANPKNAASFFRGLFEKDNGVLLAFFFDLSRADAAHQQYFTATPARAEAFYKWYMNSAGPRTLRQSHTRWQAAILQKVPPGEISEDTLARLPSLEPRAAVARLEEMRGRPMDQDSAALVAQHYEEWRHLFPYLEKLHGLGASQFRALAAFAERAAAAPPEQRALLVGEWHSMVELIVLGKEAGSLIDAQAAEAFGRVCEALRSDRPAARAIETLRALAGETADVDEGIAGGLLRLSGAKREAFERVRQLQGVPRLASLGNTPEASKTLAALSGTVYAALLDPGFLLVAEDPQLLMKHDFLPDADRLFGDSGLIVSSRAPGSHLTGGFGRLREVVAGQALLAEAEDEPPATEIAMSKSGPAADAVSTPAPDMPIFKAAGRIVEVYTTVTDSRGRYVDDLKESDFSIHVEGQPTGMFAFENHTSSVSVALLFDTTSSMSATLPSLKGAAMKLVNELRPEDAAAVYGFNDRVTSLQPFTTDKTAIKRGILRAHAAGTTALYDALVRVSRDLAQRRGKKVIILFSDGDDNASMLTAETAILRAKSRGIPIYTVAQGEALLHPRLVGQLANLSQFTGGTAFLIRKLDDIGTAFQRMSEDLMHGYLLAIQPPPDNGSSWHRIGVALSTRKGVVIRAREAYFSE